MESSAPDAVRPAPASGCGAETETMFLKWRKSKKPGMKKILVVDDDPVFVRTLIHRLEMNGFDTAVACDGEEAIDVSLKESVDLILLDIYMPRLDGHVVLERLRQMEQTKHIPVIMISMVSSREDVERASSSGAADYIVKPFDPVELVEKIERALAAHKEA